MKKEEAEITLGELGFNRFTSLKVEVETFSAKAAMAGITIKVDHEKYINFKEESTLSENGKLS